MSFYRSLFTSCGGGVSSATLSRSSLIYNPARFYLASKWCELWFKDLDVDYMQSDANLTGLRVDNRVRVFDPGRRRNPTGIEQAHKRG